jgi:heat shock protein 5
MLFLFTLSAHSSANAKHTIGIDLGTTFSCVGTYDNGRVEIIANNQGRSLTPSVVSFRNGLIYTGSQAQSHRVRSPENTIYSVTRLMGVSYSDERVQEEIKRLPYNIVDRTGRLSINISDNS